MYCIYERKTHFIFSGDLLTGKSRSSMGDLFDSLFECWRSDPVHGDKSAYIKLAMGLMDFLEPKPDSRSRKRLRTATPPPPPPDSPPPPSGNYRGREDRYEDRQHGGYRSRSHSAFSSYPPQRLWRCPPLLSGLVGSRKMDQSPVKIVFVLYFLLRW
jgi:hypothetical protein